jgi:hypothetical protein
MAISIQILFLSDNAADRVAKHNLNYAALATVSGMDRSLSADTAIADNRAQVTAGTVTVPSTYRLSILGTGRLLIM